MGKHMTTNTVQARYILLPDMPLTRFQTGN